MPLPYSTLLAERANPKIPMVFSFDYILTQVESVADSSVSSQEPLSLPDGLNRFIPRSLTRVDS